MSNNPHVDSCASVNLADTSIVGDCNRVSPLTTAKSFPQLEQEPLVEQISKLIKSYSLAGEVEG